MLFINASQSLTINNILELIEEHSATSLCSFSVTLIESCVINQNIYLYKYDSIENKKHFHKNIAFFIKI